MYGIVNGDFYRMMKARNELYKEFYMIDWPRMRGYFRKIDVIEFGGEEAFTLSSLVEYEKVMYGVREFERFRK